MSSPETKEKHSKRIQQKQCAAHRHAGIARAHGADVKPWEEHRLQDISGMNCGNPNCVNCSNPRKSFKEKTIQERSHEQDKLWID